MDAKPQLSRSLESLRKEAKRWLSALREGAADARARFELALPGHSQNPTLRDVQHALAREHGCAGWTELKRQLEESAAIKRHDGAAALAKYDAMAAALLDAYYTGTPEAMELHYSHTWHRRPWQGMRTYVQLDLGKRPSNPGDDVEITLDNARYLVARDHGFADWAELTAFTDTGAFRPRVKPIAELATDASVTTLELRGSPEVDDDTMLMFARYRSLTQLDVSDTAITDRALAVLRELPALEAISLNMTHVTDSGAAELARCHELRRVNLMWTHTGDGALRALAGKRNLSALMTGNDVTDDGIAHLHDLPVFKTWHGEGEGPRPASADSDPNRLVLRGTFTDRGVAKLRGLDGLYGLDLGDSALALSAAAMVPLIDLPNLRRLSVDAKDDWMPHIAAMRRLRFLAVQDTTAGDDGWTALAESRTIESIWGRRCHNLRARGFLALATMPALSNLSVSCLNVEDSALAALPRFPALRELMPMDISDDGYRHIAKCERLETLTLMYCRETTDAATQHIRGLPNLKKYFASYTRISDRTPEILSGMQSLESITFDSCAGLTNAGIAALAKLPNLRELKLSGMRGVTPDVRAAFAPEVTVVTSG